MTDTGNFDQIQNDKKSRLSEGNKEHPLVLSCLKKYCSAIETEQKNFAQIDECRQFVDSKLIDLATDIGGQELFPIIRKMSEGYEHPDGSPVGHGSVSGEKLVNLENLTRYELVCFLQNKKRKYKTLVLNRKRERIRPKFQGKHYALATR